MSKLNNMLDYQSAMFDQLFKVTDAVNYQPSKKDEVLLRFIENEAALFEPQQIDAVFALLDALGVSEAKDHHKEALTASDYLAKGE